MRQQGVGSKVTKTRAGTSWPQWQILILLMEIVAGMTLTAAVTTKPHKGENQEEL